MFGPPDAESTHSSSRWPGASSGSATTTCGSGSSTCASARPRCSGCTLPDPDLRWNAEPGHYDYTRPDFDELMPVIDGDGPCNRQRMAQRRRAHAEGAWVREAPRPTRDKRPAHERYRTASPDRQYRHGRLWEVFVRPRRGLSHTHVGSVHAADAEMALRNARDVYTRRQEGVSIWVVPAGADHRVEPGREGRLLRPGGRQGLPASDVLRGARRRETPVSGREDGGRSMRSRVGDDALIAAQRLGEWSARAPEMEEDVALSNIALDQLGRGPAVAVYAGAGGGR